MVETSSSLDVLKDGYLIKMGDKVKSWKKRYFLLKHEDGKLKFEYFKNPGGERLGNFELSEVDRVRLIEPPASPHTNSVIEVVTPLRTYLLTAESEPEIAEWHWAINGSLAYLRDTKGLEPDNLHPGGHHKHSSSTSASAHGMHKSGYLLKKGGKRRNWKKRWFVLEDHSLKYFAAKHDKKCLGSISLGSAFGVRRLMDTADHQRLFTIDTPTRIYYLAALEDKDVHEWLHAFHSWGCCVSMGQSTRSSSSLPQCLAGEESGGSESDEEVLIYSSNAGAHSPAVPRKFKVGDVPKPFQFPSFGELHEALRPASSLTSPSS